MHPDYREDARLLFNGVTFAVSVTLPFNTDNTSTCRWVEILMPFGFCASNPGHTIFCSCRVNLFCLSSFLSFAWQQNATNDALSRPLSTRHVMVTTANRSQRWALVQHVQGHHNHHQTGLRPFFRNHPGEPVPEQNFFMVQGKINRGRNTDHPAGRHSVWTNQCPPPPSPHFFTGRMPFLPPNQQCQSTEGQ